jgi:hypothetical protein
VGSFDDAEFDSEHPGDELTPLFVWQDCAFLEPAEENDGEGNDDVDKCDENGQVNEASNSR